MHSYKRWTILIAVFFLVVSAALTGSSNLYYMAGMLLVLPLISYSLGMLSLRGLEFDRSIPASGWDGETVTFTIIVRSRARISRLFLQARDHLSEWLEPADEEPPLFNVPPNAEVRIPYRVRLLKRGAYRLEWISVTALDPLGIWSFSRRYHIQSELLVFPAPEAMPEVVLSGAERYGFRDLPTAAARGSGIDPDGVRQYVPGDPLRRMHWKSTARTGRLNVIEFEESRAVNVVIAIDLFRGGHAGRGREHTLEYLVRAAASLAQAAVRQGASLRLVSDDRPNAAHVAGRGSDQLYAILSGLARAEADDTEPMSETLVRRTGELQAGTTLIVLASGADPGLPNSLLHYTANGAQVVLLYVDTRGFEGGARVVSAEELREVIEGALAIRAVPFLLSHSPDNTLRPEAIEDVRQLN